jgi:hypothetical protein
VTTVKLSDLEQVLADHYGDMGAIRDLASVLTEAGVEVDDTPVCTAAGDPVASFRKYVGVSRTYYYVKLAKDRWARLDASDAPDIMPSDGDMRYTEPATAEEVQDSFAVAELWDCEGDHWIRTCHGRYVIEDSEVDPDTAAPGDGLTIVDVRSNYGPLRMKP